MKTDVMQLPEGKKCDDCGHIYRCKAIFGVNGSETTCDFSPSRFQEAKVSDEN